MPPSPVRHALACIAAGLVLGAVAVAAWFWTLTP